MRVKTALTLAGPVTSPNTDTIVLKAKIQMYHGSIRSDNRLQGRRRAAARSMFSSPGRWNHRRLTASANSGQLTTHVSPPTTAT